MELNKALRIFTLNIMFVLLLTVCDTGEGIDNPDPDDPPQFNGSLFDITYNGEKFVTAIGPFIIHSVDGVNWKTIKTNILFSSGALGMTYGNETWLASTPNGLAYSTDDCATWTEITYEQVGAIIWSKVYGNGMFVAITRWGNIGYSPDGVSWTWASVPNSLLTSENCVCQGVNYGNNKFFAYGYNYSPNEFLESWLAYSEDGVIWTAIEDEDIKKYPLIRSLAYGEGKWVVVGGNGVLYSLDNGNTWATVGWNESNAFKDIIYGNGKFVAVGVGTGCGYSDDGISWTLMYPPYIEHALESVTYGAGKFVAVGQIGLVLHSPDGIEWTKIEVEIEE